MKGNAKCRKWGGLRSLKVIGNSTIRYSAYDFLLAFHMSLSLTVSEIQRHTRSNIADSDLPRVHFVTPLVMTPVEFHQDLWHQKNKVNILS